MARGNAIAERLEAIHPCFHPTWDVVADRALPVGPPQAPGHFQEGVANAGGRAILLSPRDRSAGWASALWLPLDDRAMASSGIIGPVHRDLADLLIFGELSQQSWQHRAIALPARRDFDVTNVTGLRIHTDMDLAPHGMVS